VRVILAELCQKLLRLFFVPQFCSYLGVLGLVECVIDSEGNNLFVFQYALLEISVMIALTELEQLSKPQIEPILELICILPVEDISFLKHVVDVVLNIPNQRNLMDIKLLKEVHELLLNSNIQPPYLPLSLLSPRLKIVNAHTQSFPIPIQSSHQLASFVTNRLRYLPQPLIHLVQRTHLV
jgi:hypothetical protein